MDMRLANLFRPQRRDTSFSGTAGDLGAQENSDRDRGMFVTIDHVVSLSVHGSGFWVLS